MFEILMYLFKGKIHLCANQKYYYILLDIFKKIVQFLKTK